MCFGGGEHFIFGRCDGVTAHELKRCLWFVHRALPHISHPQDCFFTPFCSAQWAASRTMPPWTTSSSSSRRWGLSSPSGSRPTRPPARATATAAQTAIRQCLFPSLIPHPNPFLFHLHLHLFFIFFPHNPHHSERKGVPGPCDPRQHALWQKQPFSQRSAPRCHRR